MKLVDNSYQWDDIKSDSCVKRAKDRGLVATVPGPQELFIDIDSAEQYAIFAKQWTILRQLYPSAKVSEDKPSPSKRSGRRHIVVTMPFVLGGKERILLQALLGSDLVREILSYVCWAKNDPNPTVLFELEANGRKVLP